MAKLHEAIERVEAAIDRGEQYLANPGFDKLTNVSVADLRTLIAALEPSEENVERVALLMAAQHDDTVNGSAVLAYKAGSSNVGYWNSLARAVLKGLGDGDVVSR